MSKQQRPHGCERKSAGGTGEDDCRIRVYEVRCARPSVARDPRKGRVDTGHLGKNDFTCLCSVG